VNRTGSRKLGLTKSAPASQAGFVRYASDYDNKRQVARACCSWTTEFKRESQMNPFCSLDLLLRPKEIAGGCSNSLQQRIHRQKLGQQLARKRAVSEPRRIDRFEDGSTVVYRRPEDWNHEQSYSTCIFLDEHNTVLASDSSGKIDIVRLPYYSSSEIPRAFGTKLAAAFYAHPTDSLKFKSLQGGKAFAVGMPSGMYQVVPTELASTSGTDPDHPLGKFSLLQMQRCASYECPRRRLIRRECVHSIVLGLATPPGQQHLVESWNSIEAQSKCVSATPIKHLLSRQHIPSSSLWDFREIGSSLTAANVESDLGCFSLRIIDDRIHNVVVCVDVISKCSSLGDEEHITACAFASDIYLATSHVRSFANGTVPSLKIWDIRFLTRRKGVAIKEVLVPPFPNPPTVDLEPPMSLDTHYKGNDACSVPPSSKSNCCSIFTALTSSSGNQGTIVATKQCGSQEIEHCVFDLARLCFTRRICHNSQSHVHGIAASHSFMGCVGGLQQDSLLMYDLQEAHAKPSAKTRNAKRGLDGERPRGSINEGGEMDSSWCSSFNPVLKDRHGLQTQLSCLALNESGTAILGGSNDGDLFLWRGS
jgi:hypothetical protein